jgi:hypothetical protein
MLKWIVFAAAILSCYSQPLLAQDDIFGSTGEPVRKGIVFGVNAGLDVPAADMAKRFGLSYRLGPSLMYKTTSNWIFGVKGDFLFGNVIRQDSLMAGIKDGDGAFINNQGERINVGIFERGYIVGFTAGRIFTINKAHPNDGILVQTGAGFIQHKIAIIDEDKTIPQLRGDFRKGYDRLSNGWYLEQFVGYSMFHKDGLLNFNLGLNVTAGFTKGRRDYLYDVMRRDDDSRLDILFGIRGGWYIPIFKKKSEEIFFE